MYKIALTQALEMAGMKYLEQHAEYTIIGSGDPDDIRSALDDSIDGIICRIGKIPGCVIKGKKILGLLAD